MTKSISVKLPDEDAEILEKILAEKQETVSVLFRKWVRENGEKGESDGEEIRPIADHRFDEILTLLWKLIESKCDSAPSQNSDPETAKKIEEVGRIVAGFPGILFTQIHELRDEILGQIPKSEGGGTIDVSGLKTSVGEISVVLKDVKEKTKNIGEDLGLAEKKAGKLSKDIFGILNWNLSLILLVVSAGFICSGYALARYVIPDIPALEKKVSALKESIRVLSFQDPKKLDLTICGTLKQPCIRVISGQSYGNNLKEPFYLIDPIK